MRLLVASLPYDAATTLRERAEEHVRKWDGTSPAPHSGWAAFDSPRGRASATRSALAPGSARVRESAARTCCLSTRWTPTETADPSRGASALWTPYKPPPEVAARSIVGVLWRHAAPAHLPHRRTPLCEALWRVVACRPRCVRGCRRTTFLVGRRRPRARAGCEPARDLAGCAASLKVLPRPVPPPLASRGSLPRRTVPSRELLAVLGKHHRPIATDPGRPPCRPSRRVPGAGRTTPLGVIVGLHRCA